MRPLLAVREATHLLHVHENTVRRWSDENIIPLFRICQIGDRTYKLDDIDNFIVRLKAQAGNPKAAGN